MDSHCTFLASFCESNSKCLKYCYILIYSKGMYPSLTDFFFRDRLNTDNPIIEYYNLMRQQYLGKGSLWLDDNI